MVSDTAPKVKPQTKVQQMVTVTSTYSLALVEQLGFVTSLLLMDKICCSAGKRLTSITVDNIYHFGEVSQFPSLFISCFDKALMVVVRRLHQLYPPVVEEFRLLPNEVGSETHLSTPHNSYLHYIIPSQMTDNTRSALAACTMASIGPSAMFGRVSKEVGDIIVPTWPISADMTVDEVVAYLEERHLLGGTDVTILQRLTDQRFVKEEKRRRTQEEPGAGVKLPPLPKKSPISLKNRKTHKDALAKCGPILESAWAEVSR